MVVRNDSEQAENVRAAFASALVSGVQGRNGERREEPRAALC